MSSFTHPSNLLQALPAAVNGKPAGPIRVPSSESTTGKIKTAKSRKRVNTAEKRASHNAVERQRREALNGRFLDLARLLPSLATARRPSKSAIVNGSIAYVTLQRAQRLLAARELRALLAERDGLLAEVNEHRAVDGRELAVGVVGGGETLDELFAVEDEVFGTFADGAMGGDHGDDDDLLLLDSDAVVKPTKTAAAAAAANKKAGSVALSDNDSLASCMPAFHPDFASQSFSSDGSSFFGTDAVAYHAAAGAADFFGHHQQHPSAANFFPKLEAMTPPSSDSTQSPLSSSARMFGSVGGGGSSPGDAADDDASDKVSSWAAEQLFAHIQAQQQQQQAQQQMQQPMSFLHGLHQQPQQQQPTLAGQHHHAQNPFTATLLANIAASSQRVGAFGLFDGSHNGSDVGNGGGGGYSVPAGPSTLDWQAFAFGPAFGQQQQHQQQQQQLGALKSAVRAGVDYGRAFH